MGRPATSTSRNSWIAICASCGDWKRQCPIPLERPISFWKRFNSWEGYGDFEGALWWLVGDNTTVVDRRKSLLEHKVCTEKSISFQRTFPKIPKERFRNRLQSAAKIPEHFQPAGRGSATLVPKQCKAHYLSDAPELSGSECLGKRSQLYKGPWISKICQSWEASRIFFTPSLSLKQSSNAILNTLGGKVDISTPKRHYNMKKALYKSHKKQAASSCQCEK